MAEFDYKEYARQMRENCYKNENGNIICSAELWEHIASIIENTADVVPKSEVERLETEIKVLTENSISTKYPCCVSCSKGLILTKSLEDYDKLIGDISSSTKIEVAREIFEEIRKTCGYSVAKHDGVVLYHTKCYSIMATKLDELEKKYTKGEHNE